MKSLVTAAETSNQITAPEATLQYWRTTGAQNLPFIKIGRRVMYRQTDIDQWLDQHTYRHTGEYNKAGSNHE
jgi:hypothetical protein